MVFEKHGHAIYDENRAGYCVRCVLRYEKAKEKKSKMIMVTYDELQVRQTRPVVWPR